MLLSSVLFKLLIQGSQHNMNFAKLLGPAWRLVNMFIHPPSRVILP